MTRAARPVSKAAGNRGIILALSVALMFLVITTPAFAHHPGAKLDQIMGSKEKYFQAIDRKAPDFTLRNSDGRTVKLSDFRDRIIILNFIYTKCPDVCPLHAEKIAEIQSMINTTPMRDLVKFITITTDPKNDSLEVLKAYGPIHGLDQSNWSFLTTGSSQRNDATRKLAESYGHRFVKTADGYQTHGIITHIIDQGGRWAANFHGLRFEPVNMALYINGLTNKRLPTEKMGAKTFWDRIKGFFQ